MKTKHVASKRVGTEKSAQPGQTADLVRTEELLEREVVGVEILTETQIAILQDRVNTLEATVETQIAILQDRANTFRDTVETQVTALQGTVTALQDQVTTLQDKIDKLDERVEKICKYLDNTQKLPIVTPPTPPVIDLIPLPKRVEGGIFVSVSGKGFLASPAGANLHEVSIVIKCSDGSTTQHSAHTSQTGILVDSTFTLKTDAPNPQTYYVAATDKSPNAQDWTGQLWSNTVSFRL